MGLSRRSFLSALPAVSALQPARAAPTAPPNIVYILADDLGYGDLASYSPESKIPTPNLNRLAREGVRFTSMHSPSAVCTPTRYGILTGRYCWRSRLTSGVLNGYSPNLIEPGRLTVASMLKRRGYHTACVGKWHLGLGTDEKTDYAKPLSPSPLDHGFDHFFGIPASLDMPPYLYVEDNRCVEQPTSTTPGQGGNPPTGPFWRGGPIAPSFKIDDVLPELTRRAVKYVESRKGKPGPFFLYWPLTGPHTPWVPLRRFKGKSGAGEYGDFTAQVDDSVGRVLDALKRTGAEMNTLVVFTSDNGPYWRRQEIEQFGHRSAAHLRGMKSDIFDGGHRIPFIARWKNHIPAGAVSHHTGCLTDFMATAASLTGFDLPSEAAEDSFNLLPLMRSPSKAPEARTDVIHQSGQGVFSIRKGDWKLIFGLGSGGFTPPARVNPTPGGAEGQLYNLGDDPGEQKDLWASEPALVARLTAKFESYRREGRSRPR